MGVPFGFSKIKSQAYPKLPPKAPINLGGSAKKGDVDSSGHIQKYDYDKHGYAITNQLPLGKKITGKLPAKYIPFGNYVNRKYDDRVSSKKQQSAEKKTARDLLKSDNTIEKKIKEMNDLIKLENLKRSPSQQKPMIEKGKTEFEKLTNNDFKVMPKFAEVNGRASTYSTGESSGRTGIFGIRNDVVSNISKERAKTSFEHNPNQKKVDTLPISKPKGAMPSQTKAEIDEIKRGQELQAEINKLINQTEQLDNNRESLDKKEKSAKTIIKNTIFGNKGKGKTTAQKQAEAELKKAQKAQRDLEKDERAINNNRVKLEADLIKQQQKYERQVRKEQMEDAQELERVINSANQTNEGQSQGINRGVKKVTINDAGEVSVF